MSECTGPTGRHHWAWSLKGVMCAFCYVPKPQEPKPELPLNPWVPMSDRIGCAVLGKLQEELNEAGAAAARCTIQGIDESEPTTGVVNRHWLEDELADVLANTLIAIDYFSLDIGRMSERVVTKRKHLERWHDLLRRKP